jgi:hypothetical protein
MKNMEEKSNSKTYTITISGYGAEVYCGLK